MEGADVHRLRKRKHYEAKERHERLVEVQHVKLFALEQLAHLLQIGWAQRDRAHRAVERNTESLPDANHISFRSFLKSVAAGDDAHIVPA